MGDFLDQYLEARVGDASRNEVLEALRGHVLRTVVVVLEAPDGSILMRTVGSIFESDRDDPESWETCEEFAIDGDGAFANRWHVNDNLREHNGLPTKSNDRAATVNLSIPKSDAEQYLDGYRWQLGGGYALAIVLHHDVLHVPPAGDLAPGLGGFTVEWHDDDAPS